MRELSLFTGAGGGILGSMLLGHLIVGAVEIDDYCCRVLEQRQRDGILARFPIFQTDIRDFVRYGYAELYQGRCEIISAGFPCQPFSSAGERLGEDDPRNLWPATADTIGIIRPRYVFLENVPNVIADYGNVIIGDLTTLGYDADWDTLGSMALSGGVVKGDRTWISAVSQTDNDRLERPIWRGACEKTWNQETFRSTWWQTEPGIQRVADGVANRVDRLKAIGNGQVPIVAATAWALLSQACHGEEHQQKGRV